MTDIAVRSDFVDLIARHSQEIIAITGGSAGEMMAISMSVVISLLFYVSNGDADLTADLLQDVANSSADRLREKGVERVEVPPTAKIH